MVENVTPPEEVSNNDKLMALLSYLTGIVAVVVLLSESGKTRAFQRYHAVSALLLWAAMAIAAIIIGCVLSIISTVTAGLGCCLTPLIIVVIIPPIYYGILAYQGKYFNIPVVTDFARNQGWLPQI